MLRFARRILVDDFGSWLPAIITVMLLTILIGVTANQFAWTHNPIFVSAVQDGGYDIAEFRIVSQTIYMIVAPLAVLSLSIVGSAAVAATRTTFANWRLVGASPKDIRRSIWLVAALAAGLGAIPGAILAIPASFALIPTFNQMAVPGFIGPQFRPSTIALLLALVAGFLTCLGGAFLPASRAAKIGAIAGLRQQNPRQRRNLTRIAVGILLLLGAITLAAISGIVVSPQGGIEVLFNTMLNVGVIAVLAITVLGAPLSSVLLRAIAGTFSKLQANNAAVAARAAYERASISANTLAPLAAGIGGAGTLLAAIMMSARIFRLLDLPGETNFADTLVMIAIISFVCLITSVAVIALSGRDTEREISLLRTAGMSRRSVFQWFAWQAVILAFTAIALSMIPISLLFLTGALGSNALIGRTIYVIPWAVIIIGFLASATTIFVILAIPARQTLNQSIAENLR